MIHETAIVKSPIPDSCTIHPYAIIGAHVTLGENVIVHSFVVINDHVEIGNDVEIFPGAYLGKEPKSTGALARELQFSKKLKIAEQCAIGPHAVIYYGVEIGPHTLIGDGASIREQCVLGSYVVIGRYVTINYNVRVGNHSKIMDHCWLAGNMEIGQDVFMSGGVLTANDNNMGAEGYQENLIQGPNIQDNALIGVGAILLPNVVIEKKSRVAAGAVVTKNVSQGVTVKGVPAKPN